MRVVGGFTEHQFAEKRLPTLDEINAAAPDTPVFILHLYDRALLNRAALRAVGYTRDTPAPPGGVIERGANGEPTGLLLANPNATLLYATLARGPKLPPEYQKNSSRHFMREVNRLGVTGVIDAGGGFQNYPEDYRIVEELHREGLLTVRIAYNLFTQKPKQELNDFAQWSKQVQPGAGDDLYRHNGAGEMLVYSAADFEDFRVERPDLPAGMEGELERVVRLLAENRWPWRLHATYNETITRALDVFEKVSRDVPFDGLHWFIDHAETIDDRNIERIAKLGGGIAVQHRMAYQGEYFVERYGAKAARAHAADPPHAGHGRTGGRGHGRDARRLLQSLGVARVARHRENARRHEPLPCRQPPHARSGAAAVDRSEQLVLDGARQERANQGRPARGSRRALARLLRGAGGQHRRHHVGAHAARRTTRPCGG